MRILLNLIIIENSIVLCLFYSQVFYFIYLLVILRTCLFHYYNFFNFDIIIVLSIMFID